METFFSVKLTVCDIDTIRPISCCHVVYEPYDITFMSSLVKISLIYAQFVIDFVFIFHSTSSNTLVVLTNNIVIIVVIPQ